MKYLVTGGSGFIGSHLVELLLEKKHKVTVLDDFSTGNPGNLPEHKRLKVFDCSVLNGGFLRTVAADCNQIYHLAAVVGVKRYLERPLETLEVNIRGTENVLEAARHSQKKVFITSSSEVYGYGGSRLKETGPGAIGSPALSFRWGYGLSKAVDEFTTMAYRKKYGVPVVIVRPFNVVGPRQTGAYGMVMPRFIKQALRGEPITVFGTGQQTRCFAYVSEVVKVFYNLMESPEAEGKIFNVAGDNEISIMDLALLVKEVLGSKSEIITIPYEEAYGPGFDDALERSADTSSLKKTIGRIPEMPLEEIIKRTAESIEC